MIPERLIITVNTFHLVSNAILVVSAISLVFSFIGKISYRKTIKTQSDFSLFSERFSAMHFWFEVRRWIRRIEISKSRLWSVYSTEWNNSSRSLCCIFATSRLWCWWFQLDLLAFWIFSHHYGCWFDHIDNSNTWLGIVLVTYWFSYNENPTVYWNQVNVEALESNVHYSPHHLLQIKNVWKISI